jgi:hypothetical protein
MRPSQVVEFAREKAEEVAEKTGEVIGKGLMEGWGKAKGLGEDLKKELLRLYGKTARACPLVLKCFVADIMCTRGNNESF